MGDSSGSTQDGKTKREEFFGATNETSPTHISVEIPAESGMLRRRRVLHRVPPQVRQGKEHIFDPIFVSIGPYHHRKPQYLQVEKLKDEVVDLIIRGARDKSLFRSKIMDRVDEIRSFYGGLSRDEHDDEALVEMMIRDACFVLYFMDIQVGNKEREGHIIESLGWMGYSLMSCDFLLLENQIPWWIIKLLNHDDEVIRKYLSYTNFGDFSILKRLPWKEGTEEEPLHLLKALCTTLLSSNTDELVVEGRYSSRSRTNSKHKWWRRKSCRQDRLYVAMKRSFRSATELSTKGVYFKPSSNYINDIRFTSHSFHGVLHLPVVAVDKDTIPFFSNIIALEMSPGSSNTGFVATSYVNFMKSLIESAKDVKLLQEKGILYSHLEDNERIVRMFKEMDTYGGGNLVFNEMKERIDEHCSSKAKTWIAELINTYFRSPWTASALVAAAFLLCLTLLQTYYTMNPRNSG